MKRHFYAMLILFAVLCAEGCWRTRSDKSPIEVIDENDFLFARPTTDVLITTKPKRVFMLDVGDIEPPQGEETEWKFKQGLSKEVLFAPNAEIKWVDGKGEEHKKQLQEAQKLFQLLEKVNRQETRQKDIVKLARHYIGFYNQYEKSPKDRTYDNLKKYVRREKAFELRFDLDAQKYKPVILIDDKTPNQLIAYVATAEEKIGHACVYWDFTETGKKLDNDTKFETPYKLAEDLKETLQSQELLLLRRLYVEFAAENYIDFSLVGGGASGDVRKYALEQLKELERIEVLGSQEQLKQEARAKGWRQLLLDLGEPDEKGKVNLRFTSILKPTPDKRELDKFRAFVKEKSPHPLWQLIEKKDIHINLEADLRKKSDLFAVQQSIDPKKGRLAIEISGTPSHRKDGELSAVFPDLVKKKE